MHTRLHISKPVSFFPIGRYHIFKPCRDPPAIKPPGVIFPKAWARLISPGHILILLTVISSGFRMILSVMLISDLCSLTLPLKDLTAFFGFGLVSFDTPAAGGSFQVQGSNPSHSSTQSHSRDHARSLTHRAPRERLFLSVCACVCVYTYTHIYACMCFLGLRLMYTYKFPD